MYKKYEYLKQQKENQRKKMGKNGRKSNVSYHYNVQFGLKVFVGYWNCIKICPGSLWWIIGLFNKVSVLILLSFTFCIDWILSNRWTPYSTGKRHARDGLRCGQHVPPYSLREMRLAIGLRIMQSTLIVTAASVSISQAWNDIDWTRLVLWQPLRQ